MDNPSPSGPSAVWIEDDVLIAQIMGRVGIAETQRLMDMSEQLFTRHGYILILIDAKHSKGMTPEARKFNAERLKRVIRPSHTALYNVSAAFQAMTSMMQRGIKLIVGKTYPVSFHRDEAEARAQLAAQRVVLRRAIS